MKDIKVIHELDEEKNQRVIIIKNKVGEEITASLDIITSENKEESYYHSVYFKEYFNHEYLEDKTLQSIKTKMSPVDSTIVYNIIYYLTKVYNAIIFMETTQDYKDSRYGVLIFPEYISEQQQEEIQKLKTYFKNFKSIMVQGKLIEEQGIIVDTEISEIIDQSKFDEIEKIIEKINIQNERKMN